MGMQRPTTLPMQTARPLSLPMAHLPDLLLLLPLLLLVGTMAIAPSLLSMEMEQRLKELINLKSVFTPSCCICRV